jgi:hypothetical protein
MYDHKKNTKAIVVAKKKKHNDNKQTMKSMAWKRIKNTTMINKQGKTWHERGRKSMMTTNKQGRTCHERRRIGRRARRQKKMQKTKWGPSWSSSPF